MPSTIPFDPALVLGNVVHPEYLTTLDAIAQAQAPIDAAQTKLNDLITLRRSLDMTRQELVQLDIDVNDQNMKTLKQKTDDLTGQIAAAAGDYASTALADMATVQTQRAKLLAIHHDVESPVDYNRTQIKQMPLSADSMQMNVQYFSMDMVAQSSDTLVQTVAGFVSDSTSFLGDSFSSQATASATQQMNSQVNRHTLDGTLVIAVTCTHKQAAVLAPFILDPDKGISAWNAINNSNVDPTDPAQLAALQQNTGSSMSLISGATYGSSFIGMVHVLKQESTASSQDMIALASSLQGQFEVSGWFVDESGGFGVDSQMANDIKNLLSTQNISSHVSLVTMGVIPSIKSNNVKIGVQQFADFDPAKMMDKLAILANQQSDNKSVGAAAEQARTGGQMVALEGATVKNTLSGLAEIDDGQNKMLDINSLMTALDDYVDRASSGQIGVPINYYLKTLTAKDLCQSWVAKYYPDKYIMITHDDSGGGGGGGGNTPAPAPEPSPAPSPQPG